MVEGLKVYSLDSNTYIVEMWHPIADIHLPARICVFEQLNKEWFKYIRAILNTEIGKMKFDFDWFKLRHNLLEPLRARILADNKSWMNEEKFEDLLDNGMVYLTCEDEDMDEWFAPTLENWWDGKTLDF